MDIALDGRILARAKAALEKKRRLNEERYERRLERVYARAPRVRILDMQIRETMSDLFKLTLDPGQTGRIEDIRLRNIELQDMRREEIKRAGFAADYADDEYLCPECRDTGYFRTEICQCLMDIYRVEQRKSLSSLLKLGDETFDSFDLAYYDDRPAPDTGVSPRRSMEIIYETCVEYARKFSAKSVNLFFNGAPGLGKTFLSACIARVVAENGHSVVYDTAASVFTNFGDAKFMRTDDPEAAATKEEARGEVRRYLDCELLILDDLGTEMLTAFINSALYELVNTRLLANKKTIVSSNLTIFELRQRYSEQIMSRLEGVYQVLTFRGDDIRRKRNMV